jgi:hypothetical protein
VTHPFNWVRKLMIVAAVLTLVLCEWTPLVLAAVSLAVVVYIALGLGHFTVKKQERRECTTYDDATEILWNMVDTREGRELLERGEAVARALELAEHMRDSRNVANGSSQELFARCKLIPEVNERLSDMRYSMRSGGAALMSQIELLRKIIWLLNMSSIKVRRAQVRYFKKNLGDNHPFVQEARYLRHGHAAKRSSLKRSKPIEIYRPTNR